MKEVNFITFCPLELRFAPLSKFGLCYGSETDMDFSYEVIEMMRFEFVRKEKEEAEWKSQTTSLLNHFYLIKPSPLSKAKCAVYVSYEIIEKNYNIF